MLRPFDILMHLLPVVHSAQWAVATRGWLVLASLVVVAFSPAIAPADWRDDVGYTRLVNVLGDATPNGAGVPISMVEAPNKSTGAYFPDTDPPTNPQFTAGTDPLDPQEDVNFIDGSGDAALGVSGHAASTVGLQFFGNTTSLAGRANTVTVYEANDWMASILHASGINHAPETQDFRVQNFSWISSSNAPGDEAENRDVLRRFDFVIDRDNVTAVVGLNNGTGVMPHLLGHSYNAIAVGRTDGSHSIGPTLNFYGPGRTKPDIVAPMGTTSAATAAVSSAATMLHEVVAGSDASQSEVMKAMLLAGATKDEIPGWSRTTTQPLDSHFGAGELNVYNGYLMTAGGQTTGSSDNTGATVNTVDSHGWDYQTVSPGGELFYNFEIPTGSTATELSIVLAWNVEVTDSSVSPLFNGTESLANLDLTLYNSTDAFLGTLVDESVSTVDNVEHLYIGPGQEVDQLVPGTYTLKVSSDLSNLTNRDFGLAWRTGTLFDEVSADFDEDGDVDGSDFLAWQRGYRTLLGATHAMGDADGDGDVDADDLSAFQLAFASPPAAPAVASIPEPATWALIAAGVLLLLHRSRPQRQFAWRG